MSACKVKIEQLESATRLTRFKAADYQMRTSLWTNDINDPNEITSYFAYYPTVEGNRSGYRNEAVEEAVPGQPAGAGSDEACGATTRRCRSATSPMRPIIFLLEVPYPVAMSKKVKDFVQIPLGNNSSSAPHLET